VSDTAAHVKRVFEEMPGRLDATNAAGMDAVIQYNLSGDGAASYYCHIRNGACHVTEGVHPDPAVGLNMSAADFVDLSHGKLDGMSAFMSGKLKAKGDLGVAMKLQKLFRRG
jgi:putative sterol carrier protein